MKPLTPAEAERLAMLAEECGEVIQAVGKILRHGYESRHPEGVIENRVALARELGDVMAIMELMDEAGDVFKVDTDKYMDIKLLKIHRYTHHQRDSQ